MKEVILAPMDWLSALGWTIIGILFVKALIYPHGHAEFNLKKWIRENIADFLKGLLLTLVTLKLGYISILILQNYVGVDFSGLDDSMDAIGMGPVRLSLVISIIFQWWLYKRYKKVN